MDRLSLRAPGRHRRRGRPRPDRPQPRLPENFAQAVGGRPRPTKSTKATRPSAAAAAAAQHPQRPLPGNVRGKNGGHGEIHAPDEQLCARTPARVAPPTVSPSLGLRMRRRVALAAARARTPTTPLPAAALQPDESVQQVRQPHRSRERRFGPPRSAACAAHRGPPAGLRRHEEGSSLPGQRRRIRRLRRGVDAEVNARQGQCRNNIECRRWDG
jgi:hypothetical protein